MGQGDGLGRDMAHVGQRFHPCGARPLEGYRIARVDIGGDVEVIAVGPLHAEDHDRAVAERHLSGQLIEVLGAPGGDGIGEFG